MIGPKKYERKQKIYHPKKQQRITLCTHSPLFNACWDLSTQSSRTAEKDSRSAFDDVSPKKMACHRRSGQPNTKKKKHPSDQHPGSRNRYDEERAKISLTKPVGQTLGIPNILNNDDDDDDRSNKKKTHLGWNRRSEIPGALRAVATKLDLTTGPIFESFNKT